MTRRVDATQGTARPRRVNIGDDTAISNMDTRLGV
ncbi:unnamed protein product [Candida parapsilosis]